MSPPQPQLGPPHAVFGAHLIGYMVATPFYGVICYQAWQYYSRFGKSDGLGSPGREAGRESGMSMSGEAGRESGMSMSGYSGIESGTQWVALVLLLDTATQCFNSHALYHYLIIHQADVRALADLVWSLVSQAGTGGLLASIVQIFFGYKVYIVSGGNVILFGAIIVLSITSLVLAWIDFIQGLRYPNLHDLPPGHEAFVPASFALIAAIDMLITGCLCYYLLREKRYTSDNRKTDNLVNKLIILFINNGVLVSTTALAALVTKLTCHSPMPAMSMTFFLSKAYVNMFLSSLNFRQTSRQLLVTATSDGDASSFRCRTLPSGAMYPFPYSTDSLNFRPGSEDSTEEGDESAVKTSTNTSMRDESGEYPVPSLRPRREVSRSS